MSRIEGRSELQVLSGRGLVRAAIVVVMPKAIKRELLFRQIRVGWIGSVLLERSVEPLVATILLGFSWLNAVRHNAQLNPKHR
jgi:hypothetical protein